RGGEGRGARRQGGGWRPGGVRDWRRYGPTPGAASRRGLEQPEAEPYIRPMNRLLWALISLVGAAAWGVIALGRGETISAAWLVLAAVGSYLVGFRFYSRFLATRVFGLYGRA